MDFFKGNVMDIRLKFSKSALLQEVAAKHGIDVSSSMGVDGMWHLTPAIREALMDAISEEFAATGLMPDSEPNSRGLQLEELLDIINDLKGSAR
jgi:hypothetical protein